MLVMTLLLALLSPKHIQARLWSHLSFGKCGIFDQQVVRVLPEHCIIQLPEIHILLTHNNAVLQIHQPAHYDHLWRSSMNLYLLISKALFCEGS